MTISIPVWLAWGIVIAVVLVCMPFIVLSLSVLEDMWMEYKARRYFNKHGKHKWED